MDQYGRCRNETLTGGVILVKPSVLLHRRQNVVDAFPCMARVEPDSLYLSSQSSQYYAFLCMIASKACTWSSFKVAGSTVPAKSSLCAPT